MNLRMETLTPVHIGCGEVLSRYSDYVFKNYYVHYIDHDKLENTLFQLDGDGKLIDEFVEVIRSQSGDSRSNRYDLKQFLTDNKLDMEEYTYLKIKSSDEIKEEIHKSIRSGSQPIIPGSSVKGAIRTALLYSHLQSNDYDLKKMEKGYKGEDVFGSYAKDIFKYLYVSDNVIPFKKEDIQIYRTIQYDIKEKKELMSIPREVLKSGSCNMVKIQSKAKHNFHNLGAEFDYLYEGNEDIILNKVNKFTLSILEREISVLRKVNDDRLNPIINKYEQFITETEQLLTTKEGAILRLGGGKTFFDNTIASLFTEDELLKMRKNLDMGSYQPFPKTRSLVVEKGKIVNVLGWIKLMI